MRAGKEEGWKEGGWEEGAAERGAEAGSRVRDWAARAAGRVAKGCRKRAAVSNFKQFCTEWRRNGPKSQHKSAVNEVWPSAYQGAEVTGFPE